MLTPLMLGLLGWLIGRQGGPMPTLPVGPFAFPGTPPTPPDAPPVGPPVAVPPAGPPVGVSPTGKPVTPGLAGHKPYPAPVPPRVIATASALLPKMPMGGVAVDSDPAGRYSVVRYRKEPHGHGKVGITAYVPFAEQPPKVGPGVIDQTAALFAKGIDDTIRLPGRLWEKTRRAAGLTPDATVTGRWSAGDLSGSNYDPRGWYKLP